MQSSFVINPTPTIPRSLLEIHPPVKKLFFTGDFNLINRPLKIAIVGTRKPNTYTKNFINPLVKKLTHAGAIIISGGALGTDILAHAAALPNTIMIAPNSLDYIYPTSNQHVIKEIAKKSLILSEYEKNYMPKSYSFIQRNRIVIGLSDLVIIPQADLKSGTMQSANIAIKQKKPIYVLPHRINESLGTNWLLQNNLAHAIYDINAFLSVLNITHPPSDPILEFCALAPSFDEAFEKFGDRILEYELEGKIKRTNGKVIATL